MTSVHHRPRLPVRVLVVDDQEVIRDGLTVLLDLLEDIEVVGTAADGLEALRMVQQHDPDVVLMDLKMPTMNGVEATRQLRERRSRARIVVLTTYDDDDWVFSALRAGALGFLTKDAGAVEIRDALLAVADGQAQLEPSVQRRLLTILTAGSSEPAHAPGAGGQLREDGLTAREQEILREIACGLDNNQIAAHLSISLATVKTHVNHLLSKTGCQNRTGLVIYAYRAGSARGDGHRRPEA